LLLNDHSFYTDTFDFNINSASKGHNLNNRGLHPRLFKLNPYGVNDVGKGAL